MLLCDKPIGDDRTCDNNCHVKCAGLEQAPLGKWFCPKCQEEERVGDHEEKEDGAPIRKRSPAENENVRKSEGKQKARKTVSRSTPSIGAEKGEMLPTWMTVGVPMLSQRPPRRVPRLPPILETGEKARRGSGRSRRARKGRARKLSRLAPHQPARGKRRGRRGLIRRGTGMVTQTSGTYYVSRDEESREFIANSRRMAKEHVEMYKDTFDKAAGNRYETLTFLRLVSTLAGGLTDEDDQFVVVPGKVFFKKAKLKSLRIGYCKNAKYNPTDIGVELDKTRVEIDGGVYTVTSVEEGMYSLTGCDTTIDQWQLLECRCVKDDTNGKELVTLDKDLRKYILSLIAMYRVVWTSFVQYLLRGQSTRKGVDRVGTSGMLEDWSKRELSSDETAELEGVPTMRRLSKLAFPNGSVEDTFHTLPVRATEEGDAGHEEATALRAFASSEGSLSKLNFLGVLGGADNTSAALVDDNDTKMMVRMASRKGESLHGAYPDHINHVVRMLQYAYRLNRPISLHEAYLPLCAAEREVLRKHFGCWDDNEDNQEDYIISPVSISYSGDKTFAMRFSLERCSEVLHVMPPTMIRVLSRDRDRYGTKLDSSTHVDTFSKVAKAFDVLRFVMGRDVMDKHGGGCQTEAALNKIYTTVKYLLHDKRLQAGDHEGKNSGLNGVATKTKKGRVPFVMFSNKENLLQLNFLFTGLYINGVKRVLGAINEIDETCAGKGGWCYDLLKAAEVAATSTKKKAAIPAEHTRGSAEQRMKIARMVAALRRKGITQQDFEIFSACASMRDLFSAATLRNQGFFFRREEHLNVNNLPASRNPGRMVARLPGKSKVSKHGNGSGNGAAREHVIDIDTGDWYAISKIVGRAFHRSFSGDNSIASQFIGPVDKISVATAQRLFSLKRNHGGLI